MRMTPTVRRLLDRATPVEPVKPMRAWKAHLFLVLWAVSEDRKELGDIKTPGMAEVVEQALTDFPDDLRRAVPRAWKLARSNEAMAEYIRQSNERDTNFQGIPDVD